MNIPETTRSLWLLLFGKRIDKTLEQGNQLIEYWRNIYRGEPCWKYYTTQGINGRRTATRYLLNAGKLVASELAGLVFAEPPEINVDKSVEMVLDYNKFIPNMQAWTDCGLALGGGALKWVLRKDRIPVIDFITAPDFVPVTYDSRGVTEADFLTTVTNDGKEYKIVEQHRVSEGGYNITVKAYERFAFSGAKEYREVSLERAGITDGEGTSPVKLFQEWKVPEANNIDHYSPLGISIYANATDTLRQIDETFDYLATELETSRRKIIIQRSMLTGYFDTAKDKTVPYYDKNEKVYVAFDAADKESMAPVAIDFELRIDAIKQTLNTLFSILSKQCGMSEGFLSFDGQSMKTATEVISENSKTFRTKQTIEQRLTSTLIPFLSALKAIGSEYSVPTTNMEYSIHWNDSIIEDRDSKSKYLLERLAARAILLEDVLMELDGLPEEEAKAKAEEIRKASATVDVGSMFGGDFEN